MANKSRAESFGNVDSNPCIKEITDSQRCLNAHNYNRHMCSLYFSSYNACRRYWGNVMIQRRRSGIQPDMPTAKEREQIISSLGEKPY